MQLRRHLKKYEVSQSPGLALISVFETDTIRSQKHRSEIMEEEKKEVENKNDNLQFSGENKENVPPSNDKVEPNLDDKEQASSSGVIHSEEISRETDVSIVEDTLPTRSDKAQAYLENAMTHTEDESSHTVQDDHGESEDVSTNFQNIKSSIELIKIATIDGKNSGSTKDSNVETVDGDSSGDDVFKTASDGAKSIESVPNESCESPQDNKEEDRIPIPESTDVHSSEDTCTATEVICADHVSSEELFNSSDDKDVPSDESRPSSEALKNEEKAGITVCAEVQTSAGWSPKVDEVTAYAPLVDYPLTQNQPAFPGGTNYQEINASEYMHAVNQFRDKLEHIERNVAPAEQQRELRTLGQILFTSLQLYTSHLMKRNAK